MKIGILTLHDRAFESVAKRTLPNKILYARRQGYSLLVERDLSDPTRNASWNKIPAIRRHLTHFDWIFWSDVDSLFTNFEIRLEGLIDLTRDLVFPSDSGKEGGFPGNNPGQPRINASHFLIRSSPWSQEFLDHVYQRTEFLDHKWWEQKAMMHVLETEPEHRRRVRTLPDRVMKSNPQNYQPGDFVVHFGGKNKVARLDAFLEENGAVPDGDEAEDFAAQAVRSELVDRHYVYRRVGRCAYPVCLRADGKVAAANRRRLRWGLRWHAGTPIVSLTSASGAVCELQRVAEGTWIGEEPGEDAVRVELVRHRAQTLVDWFQSRSGPLLSVEVGVFKGKTSAILLSGLPGLQLIMVDRWMTAKPGSSWRQTGDSYAKLNQDQMDDLLLQTLRQTRFASERRTIVVDEHLRAAGAVPDGLDFVFLDADHSYEGTLEAIRAWWPKLAADGRMAGHDYGHLDYPGVERAVLEFAEQRNLMVHVAPDYVWYLEKSS